MKKITIVLFIALLVSFTSCDKIDKLTQFEIDYTSSFKIPSNLGINLPFNFPTPDIETNISEELENNQSNKELIEQIFLKKFLLTIESPDNQTFRFLKDIDVFLVADGLPKVKIAFKHNIKNSIGQELDLDVIEQDLQEYMKKDKYSIDVSTTTDETILQEVKIRTDLKFWVDAKILGI